MIGKKFGRLTVIESAGYVPVGKNGERKSVYKCICECGKEKIIKKGSLISGHTKSCGCLEIESKKNRNITHGLRYHELYGKWLNMKDRCNNKNNTHYKYYGEKGIKVCEIWSNDFKEFYDWAINSSWKKGLTIERINNNNGYSPLNCKWIPIEEQVKNRAPRGKDIIKRKSRKR